MRIRHATDSVKAKNRSTKEPWLREHPRTPSDYEMSVVQGMIEIMANTPITPESPQPPPQPQYAPPTQTPPQPSGPAKGLALSALIVGIVAFLMGLLPVVGAIVGATAVVLGAIALNKKQPKGLAVTGLVLGAVALLSSIAVTAGLGALTSNVASTIEVVEESAPAEPTEAAPAPAPEPEPTAEPEPTVPTEFKSALRQAQQYSDSMHMSKAGIFDQLTSEYGGQFSPDAAQYAVDNVQADWNANALASAIQYQETMAMSPQAIWDQLTSEYGSRFTPAEADYAIANLP